MKIYNFKLNMDVGYIFHFRHNFTKVAITDDGGENENSNQVAGDGEDVPERNKKTNKKSVAKLGACDSVV